MEILTKGAAVALAAESNDLASGHGPQGSWAQLAEQSEYVSPARFNGQHIDLLIRA